MTQDLLHTEILEGEQLRRYLDQVQAPAELAVWLGTGQVLSIN